MLLYYYNYIYYVIIYYIYMHTYIKLCLPWNSINVNKKSEGGQAAEWFLNSGLAKSHHLMFAEQVQSYQQLTY